MRNVLIITSAPLVLIGFWGLYDFLLYTFIPEPMIRGAIAFLLSFVYIAAVYGYWASTLERKGV